MGFAEEKGIFVKSLPEHGLGLNGLDRNGRLIVKQTTQNIFKTMELLPNTKSFGLAERLSFSFLAQHSLAPGFTGSYRNAGLIFKYRDGAKQDFFLPCDMLALSSCASIPADKNHVLSNVQKYYQHKIIDRWQLFATDSIDTTLMRMHQFKIISGREMSPSELVIELVNSFRESMGHSLLSTKDHAWLSSYNECIAFKPLKIDILGFFGKNEHISLEAEKQGIPVYESLQSYLSQAERPLPMH